MAERRPGTMMTLLAMSIFVLLAVLTKSGVTQEGIASPIASTSPPPSPAAEAAAAAVSPMAEDDQSTYINASSTSEATNATAAAGPHTPGNGDVGCRGLRSKRYISDGFCRTLKPISEVLCTGYCVPERSQSWYPEFMQVRGRAKVMEYRCVDGVVQNQRIRLMCDNGKMRVYKVRVVKSCSCRKHIRPPSSSSSSSSSSVPFNRSPHESSASAAETTPVRRHNRQRHHGKKRPQPQKNA